MGDKKLTDEFVMSFMDACRKDIRDVKSDVRTIRKSGEAQKKDIAVLSKGLAVLTTYFKGHVEADEAVKKATADLQKLHHDEKTRIYTIFGIVILIATFVLGYFTNNVTNNLTNERQPIIHQEKSKKDITPNARTGR